MITKHMQLTSRADARQWASDKDTSKEARKVRYVEYAELRSLPFLCDEQAKRLRRLCKLRVRDNKIAMAEASADPYGLLAERLINTLGGQI